MLNTALRLLLRLTCTRWVFGNITEARHSPARHGDLNFRGGNHRRERLEIRETRHVHQTAHHCGHAAAAGGALPRTDTASIPRSVDLERRVCVFEGVTTHHARRHRRARNSEVLGVTRVNKRGSKTREASAQTQASVFGEHFILRCPSHVTCTYYYTNNKWCIITWK